MYFNLIEMLLIGTPIYFITYIWRNYGDYDITFENISKLFRKKDKLL